MNTEVIRAWIEANLRSIVQEGMKCLQLSAEDGYFKKAALEAAMEISNFSSMIVFKQSFWPRYLNMLKDNGRPIPVMTISDDGGKPVVVIISYEEVTANEEVKVEAA